MINFCERLLISMSIHSAAIDAIILNESLMSISHICESLVDLDGNVNCVLALRFECLIERVYNNIFHLFNFLCIFIIDARTDRKN